MGEGAHTGVPALIQSPAVEQALTLLLKTKGQFKEMDGENMRALQSVISGQYVDLAITACICTMSISVNPTLIFTSVENVFCAVSIVNIIEI